MKIKSGVSIGVLLLVNALAWATSDEPTFARYHSPGELTQAFKTLAEKNRTIVERHVLARSAAGREVALFEIGPEVGQPQKHLPAVLVLANMDGANPLATEAALYLAKLLVGASDSRKDKTWYVLPLGNSDAADRFFQKPLRKDPGNGRPVNADMDDQIEEDGPDDLDGNGIITQMRVKDPEGEWLPVPGEPRLLKKADWDKGEKGVYKLYSEGQDDDRDGQYNEDGPGGVNIGVNFPHLFRFFTATGGNWAGSEAESYYLIRFAFAHPEIAMVVTFGDANFCLTPPKGGRKGEADLTKIKIPKDIGKFLNVDAERTYTMAEIMEIAKQLAPPGYEIAESDVASFLELGAVVNPLPADLNFYSELSGKYKEFLKQNKLDGSRLEPADARDGSPELWAYYHLGLPSFALDFWTPPETKKEEAGAPALTPEKLEGMSNEEFVALGVEKIAAFLKASGAPADVKADMLLSAVKGGAMTTKKMAEMLRQLPKSKGDEGANAREKALLDFSDKELAGKGFVDWKPFRHPQLGEVEIGGFVPFADTAPPPAMVETLLAGQVPWALRLAEQLPRIGIQGVDVKGLGNGLFRLKVWAENSGYLPYPCAMGVRNQRVLPVIIELDGSDFSLIEGRKRMTIPEIAGHGAKAVSWIVRAATPVSLTVRIVTANAGSARRAIKLGGEK